MDNQPSPQSPFPPPTQAVPPAAQPQPPQKQKKVFKIIGISIAIIILAGVGFAVFAITVLTGSLSSACSNKAPKVHAEERRQVAAMNKLVIINSQATHASANGNTDCVDGGVNSVNASADFTVNAIYAKLRDEITSNLAKQGYRPVSQVGTSSTGNDPDDDSGHSTFNETYQTYKNNSNDSLNVVFTFPGRYSYICPANAKICANPNLEEIETAPVNTVEVDNSIGPFDYSTD